MRRKKDNENDDALETVKKVAGVAAAVGGAILTGIKIVNEVNKK